MRKQTVLTFLLFVGAYIAYADTVIRIEAETFTETLGTRAESNASLSGGGNVGYIENGDWIKFGAYVFDQYDGRIDIAASGKTGGNIEFRLDAANGTLIGTATANSTSGWTDYQVVSTTISKTTGIHDLYLVFTGASSYLFNIDYFEIARNNPSAINYSFTTSVSPASTGTVLSNIGGNEIEGGTVITLKAKSNYGFDFAMWTDAKGKFISSANPLTFAITSDTAIVAQYVDGIILKQTPPITGGFANTAGYGRETITGGDGGYLVVANTLDELRTYAASTEPYVIIVNGHINAEPWAQIDVNSNKTIVGYGDDATLRNIELHIIEKQNVIIRNVVIKDSNVLDDLQGKTYDYDAIQSDFSKHLWIDHCFLTNCNDGLIDLRSATDNVTVSWNHLSNHDKAFGIGWTDSTNFRITIHHNWLDHTGQRNPSFDNGIGHLYNNYLSNITSYGNFARGKSNTVIQNSEFYKVNNPLQYDVAAFLYSSGNQFESCTGTKSGNTSVMTFNPADFYSYTLDLTAEVKAKVVSGCGPQWFVGNQYIASLPKKTLNVSVASGSGTVSPESGELLSNGKIHIKATPEQGWRFDHWSGDFSGNAEDTTLLLDTNKSIMAHFVKDQLLTISIEGNGTVSPITGYFLNGEEISITATPESGWLFDHWSGDLQGNTANMTITLEADKSVTAHFIEIITLGTNESTLDESFACSYNATSKTIRILTKETENVNFVIYSIDGKLVSNTLSINSNNQDLSVGHLQKGVYILRFSKNNEFHTRRILVY
jgi:pectate lyase